MQIGFNKPYPAGNELMYIADAVKKEHISGNGFYTKACHRFFQDHYNFKKVLLTSSCTDALEMTAILLDIQPGDEVIMPSYTFASCPNAFILRGARIVFADSLPDHPNIDVSSIRSLITPRTKAILAVHYGGIACDMDALMDLSREYNIFLIEDAAQAINGYYKGRPLGGIGHMGCMSFHESKNITCGEGGLLIINDERFAARADVIWEKGTNRAAFFRGEIPRYTWIDIGSSFLPSDLTAAFLYAQLEQLKDIQDHRLRSWNYYYNGLAGIENLERPLLPDHSSNNAHCFYLVASSKEEKILLENWLKLHGIQALGHYLPLHKSNFFTDKHDERDLPNAAKFTDRLLRLPLFYELTHIEQQVIIKSIKDFIENRPVMFEENENTAARVFPLKYANSQQ
jgi:dTDP-4-amino-4,6-dideoxygalactose transaminase